MTATPILETLAREFDAGVEHVRNALEMLDAGLAAPFIGRFRRAQVGGLSESALRRIDRRRQELVDLDRRRGTILRLLEREQGITPARLDVIRNCMDRFELEDLFLPHRRPEPEVQLALDRGLGELAELLVTPQPREAGDAALQPAPELASEGDHEPASDEDVGAALQPGGQVMEIGSSERVDDEEGEGGASAAPAEPRVANIDVQAVMSAHLARLCARFVQPDRGVHTESEALAGALRVLSDRLGRDPHVRGAVRQALRKHGVLCVRPSVDDGRAARWRSLLKLRQPLKQVQGHRLLGLRQAQKERVLGTYITLDPQRILPRVRAALGKNQHPAHERVLDEVARQALRDRLLPMIEQDVRLELKERADAEALRFLSQHLRQILLTPCAGRRPIVGVDVSARGDWTLVRVDADGRPSDAPCRVEVGEKDAAALGQELAAFLAGLADKRVDAFAIGNGKGPRAALGKLRAALKSGGCECFVFIVNEAGLSSAASSEQARAELPELTVPQRCAVGLARRLQDPLNEILKVDPRHLGLGTEQGLVSKANVRRALDETIESCVAHVGCSLNEASESFLRRLPGIGEERARSLVARRAESSFASREDLRNSGILDEAQWTSAVAFLRVPESSEPLDRTALHPEQYPLVRRVLESAGAGVEESLGRPGSARGLDPRAFDLDEATWKDIQREIAFPGRDPRLRLFPPILLDPATDPIRLIPERVVEGVVSNVTSFGAFVDVGLEQDAMIHISELSARYVRDARELLSIGQVVRARILDASGPRLTLSLKNVPRPEREAPRREADRVRRGGGAGGARQGGRGGRREPVVENVRAAQTRRDGIGAPSGRGRGGKRPGGPGRPGDDRARRGRDQDEGPPLSSLPEAQRKAPAFSPFAAFFKARGESEGEDLQEA